MENNQYTAATPIKIAGKIYSLLFTWERHGEIRTYFGDKKTKQILQDCYPDEIGKMIAIGLKTRHPEITAETLLTLDPPINLAEAVGTLSEALIRSIQGGRLSEKEDNSQNPPQKTETATQ